MHSLWDAGPRICSQAVAVVIPASPGTLRLVVIVGLAERLSCGNYESSEQARFRAASPGLVPPLGPPRFADRSVGGYFAGISPVIAFMNATMSSTLASLIDARPSCTFAM